MQGFPIAIAWIMTFSPSSSQGINVITKCRIHTVVVASIGKYYHISVCRRTRMTCILLCHGWFESTVSFPVTSGVLQQSRPKLKDKKEELELKRSNYHLLCDTLNPPSAVYVSFRCELIFCCGSSSP